MAIIDRIKYDGPQNSAQWLIHKYQGEEFVLGSQLIVNQGQEALFFKGKPPERAVCSGLRPGRIQHTMPVIVS